MSILTLAPRLSEVIDPDQVPERVATGFLFTEGPLWDRDGAFLLFSDLAGDVIRRLNASGEIEEFRKPSGKANGLARDSFGRLIACEHVGRRVTRTNHNGSIAVLADRYAGQPLNSPNDVVVRSDGSIYFSDPPYGLQDFYGIARPQELLFQGIYRIAPDGVLELCVQDFAAPNGLCFSRDESLLYVDDTERGHIRAFDVRSDGSLAGGQVFFDYPGRRADWAGGPDGMKLDDRGNLWATGPGGVWIVSPAGEALGVIRLPESPSNLTWGGRDRRTLYMTAVTSVYRVETLVAGNL